MRYIMKGNINTIIFILCLSSTILVLPDSIIKNLEIKLFQDNDTYLKYMSITTISASMINLMSFLLLNHFTPFSKYIKYQINTAFSIFSIIIKMIYLNPYKTKTHSLTYYIFMKSLQSIDTTLLLPITLTYLFINEYKNRNQLISRLNGFIYLVGFLSPFLLNVFIELNYINEYQVLFVSLIFQLLQMVLIYLYIPRGKNYSRASDSASDDDGDNKHHKVNYSYCSLTIATTFILKISQLSTFAFIPVIISVGLMNEKPYFTNISLNYLNGIYSLISLLSYFVIDKFMDKLVSRLLKTQGNNKQKDHIHLFIANCVNLILNVILSFTINGNNKTDNDSKRKYLVLATWSYMIVKSIFQYNSNIILIILINHVSMCNSGKKLDKMNNNLFSLFTIMELMFASVVTYAGFKLYQYYNNTFHFLYLGLFLAGISFVINLLFFPNIIKNEYMNDEIDKQKEILETPLLMDTAIV